MCKSKNNICRRVCESLETAIQTPLSNGFIGLLSLIFVVVNIWFIYAMIIGGSKDEGELFVEYMTACLTFILVLVAWVKIGDVQKTTQSTFLLGVDSRWGDPKILEARALICRIEALIKKDNACIEKIKLREAIGERIKSFKKCPSIKSIDTTKSCDSQNCDCQGSEISNNTCIFNDKCNSLILLVNFLDFLETIGYLHSNGHVSVDQIDSLFGNSILYYHEIFIPYLNYVRSEENDPTIYSHFTKLADEMRARGPRGFTL